MAVIIGSARIDENGHAHGGVAGDQKQSGTPDRKGEVSMQDFYVHSKGWYIFRAKSDDHAAKLAKCMKRACNNPNIGYDQYQRDGIIKYHTNTETKTECDCSSLVRECIIEATGKDPGNIRTISMPDMLSKTDLFKKRITYSERTRLYTGDILVTKTSGHTVIVVSGIDRSSGTVIAEPTLRIGSEGTEVKILQKNLNRCKLWNAQVPKLEIDGVFGKLTEDMVIRFQEKQNIDADGIYGPISAKTMDKTLND